jgi:hypothetical protein
MTDEKKERYDDENLSDEEKESGRLRQPGPEEERTGTGQDTKFDKSAYPERDDEFGDGDRRS